MSSPRSLKIEEPSTQDWNMDASNSESNNPHHGAPHESAVHHESGSHQDSAPHHENGENGTAPPEMDESGPLLPSKTAGGPDLGVPGAKPGTIYREKQIKVLISHLPSIGFSLWDLGLLDLLTEDLQSCFGKIGRIASIELKVGFGFVEFVDRDAAEESVAKYNEGYFMGNKIRVELSHGGGRTAKFAGEPGACFKCGQMGHWARECPNHVVTLGHRKSEPTLLDRVHPPRDPPPPASSRAYSPYRDDYRHASTRDSRYGFDYPPPPPPPAAREPRDYRPRDYRPASPPREHRDYPTGHPPPPRQSRDVDDYRRDFRGPSTAQSRYESRPGYYPDADYPSRPAYAPPPSRDVYDSRGYDKRPPPNDRYPPYPPPGGRPRTPPRARDDYDKPHPPRLSPLVFIKLFIYNALRAVLGTTRLLSTAVVLPRLHLRVIPTHEESLIVEDIGKGSKSISSLHNLNVFPGVARRVPLADLVRRIHPQLRLRYPIRVIHPIPHPVTSLEAILFRLRKGEALMQEAALVTGTILPAPGGTLEMLLLTSGDLDSRLPS
ncbi:hypothetical protein BU17DRAFT_81254 [Hysterangium stoloniferum]|nr:hypothetical protein BU17DRAFT_81254 [Hysterangium stoloniferum]